MLLSCQLTFPSCACRGRFGIRCMITPSISHVTMPERSGGPLIRRRHLGYCWPSRCIHAEAREVIYQQHLTIQTEDVTVDEIFARLCKTLLSRVRHVTLAMPAWEIEGGYLSPVAGLLYLIWTLLPFLTQEGVLSLVALEGNSKTYYCLPVRPD